MDTLLEESLVALTSLNKTFEKVVKEREEDEGRPTEW
jgi:hypothetical protein